MRGEDGGRQAAGAARRARSMGGDRNERGKQRVLAAAFIFAGLPAAVSQQCSVTGAEGAAGLYGLANCPCLVPPSTFVGEVWEFRSASGFGAAGPDLPNSENVILNNDGLGLFAGGSPLAECTPGTPGCVEQDYGHLCGKHDWGTEPWCSDMSDPAQLDSWCADTWCYVGEPMHHREPQCSVRWYRVGHMYARALTACVCPNAYLQMPRTATSQTPKRAIFQI
jgi:hypothetical protein